MIPLPYCGAPALPEDVWLRWNTDPALLAALPLLALAHFVLARPAGPRPITCFLGAWGLLAIVFISPFCALASALFAARTLHHVLMVTAVAPLLVLAGGAGARRGPGAVPLALLHAMILWAWHAPAAYALALADTTIYWLMQAALLSSAVALWRTVLAPAAPIGAALAALALTLAQTGLLGALLTFARVPLYAFHHATTWPWGLSPLADQQLAGALMWTLGALPYLAAALALVASRLAPSDPAAPEAAR
jgi:putative membrane protein